MSDFSEWVERHGAEIKQIRAMLADPLDDGPARRSQQVRSIEAQYGRVTFLLAYANNFLDGAENDAWKKSMEGISAQKEAIVAEAVREERLLRDVLAGMEKAIERRISLAQSFMRVDEREAHASRAKA